MCKVSSEYFAQCAAQSGKTDVSIHQIVESNLHAAIVAKQALLEERVPEISQGAEQLVATLKRGRSIFLIGNGGSAADAQHIACEMEGRYFDGNRRPLPVQALTTNSSSITAIGNDYDFEAIYSRQVEAYVKEDDVLIAISTSGNSPNILRAAELARKQGAFVLGMTGESGGKLEPLCNLCIRVPDRVTPRIQECHILIGHTLCDVMEQLMFPDSSR